MLRQSWTQGNQTLRLVPHTLHTFGATCCGRIIIWIGVTCQRMDLTCRIFFSFSSGGSPYFPMGGGSIPTWLIQP
ncbi:uncharacterized protein BDW47DRAFT_100576 [Aspergillus candidus]|uniref:Uncharacterized protein n=1 Tax=Aspergillus candidus TaxID=41067 RepID=A0A2I2FKK4_ASPCN|nr:hypothetical protein BDW47DRAFT_100576 [Aspergillus candidus]PLB41150.1 hypothetical protein BDW47DRAFT_100576 [Aspergillus candidus]